MPVVQEVDEPEFPSLKVAKSVPDHPKNSKNPDMEFEKVVASAMSPNQYMRRDNLSDSDDDDDLEDMEEQKQGR